MSDVAIDLPLVLKHSLLKRKQLKRPGPWKAWVRMHTFMKDKPNFVELGQLYREAKANDTVKYKLCQRMSAASAFSSASRPVGGMFGAKGRQCRKAAMGMSRFALWQRTRLKCPLDKAKIVAKHTWSISNLGEALTACKKHQMLDGAAKKKALQAEKDALQAWEMKARQEQVNMLKQALPTLPVEGLPLQPLPSAHGLCLYLPGIASPAASKALAWATQSQCSNLPSHLQQEWEEMHTPIPQPADKIPTEKKNQRPCREEGICLCEGVGDRLYRMRNRILKEFKVSFLTKQHKQQLSSGAFVMRFVLEKPCPDCVARQGVVYQQEWWFHVAHMSFSPYRPTLQKLLRHCPLEELVDNEASIDLQATFEFFTDYHAFQQLCTHCSWSLAWYALEQTGRPLTHITPDVVTVHVWEGNAGASHFWPLIYKRRAIGQAAARAKHLHPAASAAKPLESDPLEDMQLLQDFDDLAEDEAMVSGEEADQDELQDNHLRLLEAEALDYLMALEEEEKAKQDMQADAAASSASQHQADPAIVSTHHDASASSAGGPCAVEGGIAVGADVEHESVPRLSKVRGLVVPAAAIVEYPHGRIAYHESKQGFEAVCTRHPGCSLSRTARAKKRKSTGPPVGGRPLGLLAHWIQDTSATSKAEHKEPSRFLGYSVAAREAARADMLTRAGGTELQSYERPPAEGEGLEPEHLQGYM
eukprot:3782324-Amphidinium_carterae.1